MNNPTTSIQHTLATAVANIDIAQLQDIPNLPVIPLDEEQAAALAGISPGELTDYLAMDCDPRIRERKGPDGSRYMEQIDTDGTGPLAVWNNDLGIWLLLNRQGSDSIRHTITRNRIADLPNEFIVSAHKKASQAREAMIGMIGGSPLARLETAAGIFSQAALLHLVAGLSLAAYCAKVRQNIDADELDAELLAGFDKSLIAKPVSLAAE